MKITVLDRNTVTIGDIDLSIFDKFGDVTYFDAMEHEKLSDAIKDSEVVICNKAKMTKEIMENCPNLKYVGLFATGYNNVDLDYANERGIVVCNAPGYSTDSVVQHVFALLLNLANSTAKYTQSVEKGDWVLSPLFTYFPYPIIELAGKTMGIIGLGTIGKKVAKVAESFGMNVLVHTRTIPENSEYTFVSKEELFKNSDVISLNCPLNKGTEKIVNKDTLSLMKKSAFIINTSRGGTIDEDALKYALENDLIAGAGLDVLTEEPMRSDCVLKNTKNCIITPHTAWASKEARTRLVKLVCDNIEAFLNGSPVNKVN